MPARPKQKCLFGSILKTPICIDTKPCDDVDLDVRVYTDDGHRYLAILEVRQEPGGTRRAGKVVGQVTSGDEKDFLFRFLHLGTSRATIKRNISQRESRYGKAGPGEKITPGHITTVAVNIHCEPSSCEDLFKKAENAQQPLSSRELLKFSLAMTRRFKSEVATDDAAAHAKGPQGASKKPVNRGAGPGVLSAIQRAINKLRPKDTLPRTAAPPEITISLHAH